MALRFAEAGRDLREDCLTEAASIIAERGLEVLSLREVARRLGVSHQAPYKHFESRDHILAELTIRAPRSFAAKLEAREHHEDHFADLEAVGRAYFEYAKDDPLSYQLMFGTPLIDPAAYPELAEAGGAPSRSYWRPFDGSPAAPRTGPPPARSLTQ